ncbi:hypothetical protein Tco_0110862 [Tanacetum coccineum]
MVEPERVKVDAYIRGLIDNIKGEVTSSKPADLNEAMRMAHKLMDQKAQARDARILKGKKQNQKQRNARAMVTAPTNGKLPLCEHCFTRHVGQCTIKCHKCRKIGNKARYCKEKSVATGANAQPVWTCYDYGEQGHTRNRCTRKVKQEEVREVRGRAYAIKDAEPQGPITVTGTFLLNNRYAFVLFDSGSDKSFVDSRFSSMLDIDPVKIGANYKVELADGRVLGTFDVIIGIDWLVKHDTVIVFGEKFVRILYGNKMLIVESDKGVSRLKVISCIKACKYIERRCHLFLAHVTKKKSIEKRLKDVPVIRNFPEDLPGLPSSSIIARIAREGIYSSEFITVDDEEHGKHLNIILELLKKESGVHVDLAKIEAIKSWAAPMTPTELTQKNKKYEWGEEEDEAF